MIISRRGKTKRTKWDMISSLKKELIIAGGEWGGLEFTAILRDPNDERKMGDTDGVYGINFDLNAKETEEVCEFVQKHRLKVKHAAVGEYEKFKKELDRSQYDNADLKQKNKELVSRNAEYGNKILNLNRELTQANKEKFYAIEEKDSEIKKAVDPLRIEIDALNNVLKTLREELAKKEKTIDGLLVPDFMKKYDAPAGGHPYVEEKTKTG